MLDNGYGVASIKNHFDRGPSWDDHGLTAMGRDSSTAAEVPLLQVVRGKWVYGGMPVVTT